MAPSLPFHRFNNVVPFTQAGSLELVRAGEFQPALVVVEGLDLVNNPVNEGSQANVELQNPGTAGAAGTIFQAIVYATSQGSFSWRGELAVFTTQLLNAVVISGEWFITAWGYVEPAYGIEA